MECPRCHKLICDCLLEDPGYLARAVGKQLGQLLGGKARRHTTRDEGNGGDADAQDNGGASTPQWLFDMCNQLAVEACGEPITLDVAAAPWNHKCERYFTEQDDGRAKNWDAKAAWCNPPYTAPVIEAFVRRAIGAVRRGTTTFCLLPSWNYPYLDLCEQHGRVHRICGPVTFKRQDGATLTLNNGYRSTSLVVVVFGPTVQPGFGTPIHRNDALAGDGNRRGDICKKEGDSESNGDGNGYSDDYFTPPEAIKILLPYLPKDKIIFECAWGEGHLAHYLQTHELTVVGSPELNFINDEPPRFDILATNPPFSKKLEFLQRAYSLAKPFAILLPARCLTRVKFIPLFETHGVQLLVPDKRIHFIGGSDKYRKCPGSNFHTFWFCWNLLPQGICFAKL